ncbi:MAG TPA: hypothetical protein IAC25_07110 [Candidatus Enterenecus stercoripullorum]|nr:hypothetical protein [Candidatus Enterenecus stercoripullorum]
MRKGISVSVFILGLTMTCASIAIMTLGAVGMGKSRPRRGKIHGLGRKNS